MIRPGRLAGLFVTVAAAGAAAVAAITPAAVSPPEASLRQVDGGPGFYQKFAWPLPARGNYFPVGVWFEAVTSREEAELDKAAGLNLYVMLTGNSNLSVVRAADMDALLPTDGSVGVPGRETSGWMLADEVDMWAGDGEAPWTGSYVWGQACVPGTAACGYTIMQTLNDRAPADRRLRYANYGKGVLFWEPDLNASRFVNRYQDVVSTDAYWFTDPDVCGAWQGAKMLGQPGVPLTDAQCRLAANYGRQIDRVRGLVNPPASNPVWAFVELGHPFSGNGRTITPSQVIGAVWSSLIHGARGIVYFNHSFGGPCISHHVLRETCYVTTRAAVRALNQRIARLAPVLNAPYADNVFTADPTVDWMTKRQGTRFYVFAMPNRQGATTATFRSSCVGDATATVLGENRSIPVRDGVFSDSWSGPNVVHVYRVDGGSDCGLLPG